MTTSISLSNSSSFTSERAKIIEFSSSNAASFHQIDVIDDGRVERKNPFHANSEAGLSDGDGFAGTAVLSRDHHTLESLQSLFGCGFFDPDVNPDRVARLKLRNVCP